MPIENEKLIETHEEINGTLQLVSAEFATFPTLAACFEKHSELITATARYAPAWKSYLESHHVERLAIDIAPIYATDPEYAAKLLRLMKNDALIAALA